MIEEVLIMATWGSLRQIKGSLSKRGRCYKLVHDKVTIALTSKFIFLFFHKRIGVTSLITHTHTTAFRR